ncbi:hypothetical protein B0H10DRAFT_135507 [Mycena sp. CBHHK59/15]|nr:hypothetical protein B0H10DRAFT_135507 [Mycena sp. CBHHK59/15]
MNCTIGLFGSHAHINGGRTFPAFNSCAFSMRINHLLIAAFSRLFLSAFAFPASLPTAIERSDGARAEQLTTLHPGLHPDEDASDLDNLKANKESSLYYTASPDSKRQGAGVLQLTHLYPAVSLERSEFISSVTCNSASTIMTVTFKDTSSFQTALADWSQHHTGFLLISYIAGCGTGVDSSERSFHLISGISASNKDLQIFCQMKTIPIHDTVHEEQEMRFSVVTYSLKNLTPPTKRSNTTHDLSPRGTLQEGYKVAKTVLGIFNPLAVTALELLERIEFNSHETINTEQFTTSSLKPFDSTFDGKPAYKLLHLAYDGKSSAKKPASTDPKADNDDGTKTSGTIAGAIKNGSTASLDLFCVNCGLGMTLHYTGNFVGSYKKGFSEANMEVTADITATLVLGIEAQYEYDLADKELFSVDKAIPNAGIEIPKVLKIGTFIVFVVEANFNVKLHGLVSFGYICTWKGVGAKLDFKDSSQSKVLGDWSLEANCKQEKSFNVELTVKFTPVVKLSLKVEIALFQGFTDKLATSVSLVEKLSLPLTAAFSTQPFKDCKAREIGVEAELVSDLYVIATAAKKSTDPFSLVDFKIPLYKNCFDLRIGLPALNR